MKVISAFAGAMAVILLIIAALNMSAISGLQSHVRNVENLRTKKLKRLKTKVDDLATTELEISRLKKQVKSLQGELENLRDQAAGLDEAEIERIAAVIATRKAELIVSRAIQDLRGELGRELDQRLRRLQRSLAAKSTAGAQADVVDAGAADRESRQKDMERGMRAIMDTIADRVTERADLTEEQSKKMRQMMSGMSQVWQDVLAGNTTREEAREKMKEFREEREEFLNGLTEEQRKEVKKMMNRGRSGGGRHGRRGRHGDDGDDAGGDDEF